MTFKATIPTAISCQSFFFLKIVLTSHAYEYMFRMAKKYGYIYILLIKLRIHMFIIPVK